MDASTLASVLAEDVEDAVRIIKCFSKNEKFSQEVRDDCDKLWRKMLRSWVRGGNKN
jgi:hypothetical protein